MSFGSMDEIEKRIEQAEWENEIMGFSTNPILKMVKVLVAEIRELKEERADDKTGR